MKESGEAQVSTSDHESRQIMVRNNITEVAYSVQTTVDAKKTMNKFSCTDTLCSYEFFYEQPHMVIHPRGIPFLRGYGVLYWDENRCITSIMNLYTGEVTVKLNECYIIN